MADTTATTTNGNGKAEDDVKAADVAIELTETKTNGAAEDNHKDNDTDKKKEENETNNENENDAPNEETTQKKPVALKRKFSEDEEYNSDDYLEEEKDVITELPPSSRSPKTSDGNTVRDDFIICL